MDCKLRTDLEQSKMVKSLWEKRDTQVSITKIYFRNSGLFKKGIRGVSSGWLLSHESIHFKVKQMIYSEIKQNNCLWQVIWWVLPNQSRAIDLLLNSVLIKVLTLGRTFYAWNRLLFHVFFGLISLCAKLKNRHQVKLFVLTT